MAAKIVAEDYCYYYYYYYYHHHHHHYYYYCCCGLPLLLIIVLIIHSSCSFVVLYEAAMTNLYCFLYGSTPNLGLWCVLLNHMKGSGFPLLYLMPAARWFAAG
jgi:hypothetical protein